jgi:hypothetical protein
LQKPLFYADVVLNFDKPNAGSSASCSRLQLPTNLNKAENVPLNSNRGYWIYSNYFSDFSNQVEKLILDYSKNFEISVEKFRNQEVALDSIQCYETGQM